MWNSVIRTARCVHGSCQWTKVQSYNSFWHSHGPSRDVLLTRTYTHYAGKLESSTSCNCDVSSGLWIARSQVCWERRRRLGYIHLPARAIDAPSRMHSAASWRHEPHADDAINDWHCRPWTSCPWRVCVNEFRRCGVEHCRVYFRCDLRSQYL